MTSAAARPLRRDAERNRERILEAAGEVFAEHGLEVTLDEIAKHAGVGVGTVYRRFPSREAIIEALFERKLGWLIDLAEQCLRHPDAWAGLVTFLEKLTELQATDRGFREVLLSKAYGKERVAEVKDRCVPIVEELWSRAQRSGALRPDVRMADMPVIQLMLSASAEYTRAVRPDGWCRYLGIILDGLRTRRDGPTDLRAAPLSDREIDEAMHCFRPPRRP